MSDFSQPLVGEPPVGALSVCTLPSMPLEMSTTATWNYNTVATGWTNANQAVYQAVILQQQVTVTHLAVFVQTAAGNIDVGIYNERGNRLVSSGSTAVSGSAVLQSFDVTDTTLTPGLYWLACTCSSTSAALRTNTGIHASTAGAMARAYGIMVESSALPLPATATFAAGGANTIAVPFVAAMYRTTF